jgi:DNA-binding NtrC family response regulator
VSLKRSLTLLVVDDDDSVRRVFRDLVVPRENVDLHEASSAEQALERLKERSFDVVFMDVRMPGLNGMDLLERVKRERPTLEVVMVTAHGTIESAVQAMKLGAADFLPKPFKLDQVSLILRRVSRVRTLQTENEHLRRELGERHSARNIVGTSRAMRRCQELIDRIRQEACNVLILGESGTGKELVARALHYGGPRGERLFVPIDCAAIQGSLLESELFGHEKGAFTGAHARKSGLFETASGGTVLLDEVGEIPLELQPALLRVLEEREIRAVGATEYRPIDVRIIAATNRPLEDMVAEGRFRRDLYYRLNTVTIAIPPLRERREDIALLADHFLRAHAAKGGRRVAGISRGAMRALMDYDWPGNVRELQHAVERACALGAGEELVLEDLAPEILRRGAAAGPGQERSMEELERDAIARLLVQHGGDTLQVAAILRIDRSTLYRKVKRFGIDLPRPRKGGAEGPEGRGSPPRTARGLPPRARPSASRARRGPRPARRRSPRRSSASRNADRSAARPWPPGCGSGPGRRGRAHAPSATPRRGPSRRGAGGGGCGPRRWRPPPRPPGGSTAPRGPSARG